MPDLCRTSIEQVAPTRRQSNSRIRRTEAEWAKILEQYERSGLSAAAFRRKQKLSKTTFVKWKRGKRSTNPMASARSS